jgi:hypothetical protein
MFIKTFCEFLQRDLNAIFDIDISDWQFDQTFCEIFERVLNVFFDIGIWE